MKDQVFVVSVLIGWALMIALAAWAMRHAGR